MLNIWCKRMAEKQDLRQLVRIANVDMDGAKPIFHQLTKVKGVGSSYSNMICSLVGIPKKKKTGELTEEEMSRIEKAISNPMEFGAPAWMVNRRNDPETGKTGHLIGNDLIYVQDNDIKIMKKIRSYKGVRHSLGQPVRGQRTKSNFRRNKGKAMGVKRKGGAPAAADKK